MDAPLKSLPGTTVTLATILRTGHVPPTVVSTDAREALGDHVRLVGQYCEAVSIYRANLDPVFDVRILVDRGGRMVDRIKPFMGLSEGMGTMSIELMDMLLRGDRERATPEAMIRRPAASPLARPSFLARLDFLPASPHALVPLAADLQRRV